MFHIQIFAFSLYVGYSSWCSNSLSKYFETDAFIIYHVRSWCSHQHHVVLKMGPLFLARGTQIIISACHTLESLSSNRSITTVTYHSGVELPFVAWRCSTLFALRKCWNLVYGKILQDVFSPIFNFNFCAKKIFRIKILNMHRIFRLPLMYTLNTSSCILPRASTNSSSLEKAM